MIQRIQTLFFAASAIIAIVLFIVPFAQWSSEAGNYILYGCRTVNAMGEVIRVNYELIVELSGMILLNLISLFSYKKRGRQMQLGKLSILVSVLFLVNGLLYTEYITLSEGELVFSAKVGMYLAIIPLITSYLAVRFVKKDDNLVRAADRLR